MRKLRKTLWGLAVLAVLGLGIAICTAYNPSPPLQRATSSAIEPVFNLTDHNGKSVSEIDYRGKWLLVFFGFTHCPDVCPTTLAEVAQVIEKLGTDAEKVQPLFITVDPERDTPEVMAEYASIFHPSIIGLTGTKEQATQAANNFRAYYSRIEEKDAPDGYFMDHSAFLYLIDPEGRFVEPFAYDDTVTEIVQGIRKHKEAQS